MYKNIIFLLILLSVFSCTEKKEVKTENKKTQTMSSNTTLSAGTSLTVCKDWIRPSAKDRNSALYFNVINASTLPDTLLSAESDIAKVVEIHETYKKSADMMGMRQLDFIEIPAQDTILFKPKSYHVMLIGLNQNLKMGDTASVSLNFAAAGKITLESPIQDQPTKSCCEE